MLQDLILGFIDQCVRTPGFAVIWAAIGTLLGAYVSHRYAVRRDIRKEWNQLTDPLRESLVAEIRSATPYRRSVGESALDQLHSFMKPRDMDRLRAAVQSCAAARQESTQTDESGQASYSCTDHVQDAAREVLRLMPRR